MRATKQPTWMVACLFACLLLARCATPAPTGTPTPVPRLPTKTLRPTSTPTPLPPLPTDAVSPTAEPTSLPPTLTRTPLPPPISPEFPAGRFFHPHSGGVFCVWQFNQDGTYAYFWMSPSVDVSGRTPYIAGTYSVDGNLYTETSETGTGSAFCEASTATYAWSFDGETLAFQVVGEDDCAERQRIYESALKWTKVE